MAGIGVTTARAADMMFSSPYVDETLSFVVPDHRRADFSSAEWVRATLDLPVVVPDLGVPSCRDRVCVARPRGGACE